MLNIFTVNCLTSENSFYFCAVNLLTTKYCTENERSNRKCN